MKAWLAILSFVAAVCVAQAEEIYTWTDAEGVVHYSATPPPGQKAEREDLRFHRGDPAVAAAAQKRWSDAEKQQRERDAADAAGGAKTAAGEAERQQACADARDIIQRLQTMPAARYRREDGTFRSYSPEEAESRIAEARAREQEYCD